MKKITTDKALIFSAIVLLLYTIVSEIQIFMDKVPDSTLTGAFFVAFGVAEGGYCAFIHHTKKKHNQDTSVTDEADDGNLVIDLESED